MTDLKISALTDGGGLLADDEVAVNRSGVSFKARGVGTDGWISDTAETWTFASFAAGPPAIGTFTVAGDLRSKYAVGTRIKLTQTTVKYFVVSADPTFAGGNTTVTITGGTDYTLANAAISVNYHSYNANPQGYPGWFNCAAAATGFSAKTADAGRFNITGRVCTVWTNIVGTSNATTFTWVLPVAPAHPIFPPCLVQDAGTSVIGRLFASGSTTATMGNTPAAGGGFTASGSKNFLDGVLVYEI